MDQRKPKAEGTSDDVREFCLNDAPNYSPTLNTVLYRVKEEFDSSVPNETKKKMFNLLSKPPLWREICKKLYSISPAKTVDRDSLIKLLGESIGESDVGYSGLEAVLKEMEKEGYLKIERGSENYLLTKISASIVEIMKALEDIVEPVMSKIVSQEFESGKMKEPPCSTMTMIYEAIM